MSETGKKYRRSEEGEDRMKGEMTKWRKIESGREGMNKGNEAYSRCNNI